MRKALIWAAFWGIGVLWGSSFLAVKVALDELQPFTLVLLRVVVSVLGLWVIIAIARLPLPRDRDTLLGILFMGVFNSALPFMLISWGQQFIPSSVGGILNGTVPLFSLVIAHFALADERITRQRLAGLAIGFAGVVLIFSEDLLVAMRANAGPGATGNLQGQLAIVGAALCYGGTAVFVRRYLRHVNPLVLAGGSLTFALVPSAIAAFVLEAPLSSALRLSQLTWLSVMWLGLFVTSLAYVLNYVVIGEMGATRATLATYIIPVVAFLLGAIVLDEAITWQLVAGTLLIFGGITLVNRAAARPSPLATPAEAS